MGSDWLAISVGVRDIHSACLPARLRGIFEIQASESRLGRLLCRLGRLPTRSQTVPCDVLVEAAEAGERWNRALGSWSFSSTQLESNGSLVERIGAFDLHFRLSAENGGIRFRQVGAWLRLLGVRVPIPALLAPKVVGLESPGAQTGSASIDIAVSAPLVGMLLRYRGDVSRAVE